MTNDDLDLRISRLEQRRNLEARLLSLENYFTTLVDVKPEQPAPSTGDLRTLADSLKSRGLYSLTLFWDSSFSVALTAGQHAKTRAFGRADSIERAVGLIEKIPNQESVVEPEQNIGCCIKSEPPKTNAVRRFGESKLLVREALERLNERSGDEGHSVRIWSDGSGHVLNRHENRLAHFSPTDSVVATIDNL